MGVTITPIDDASTRAFILESLQRAGYAPRVDGSMIRVEGAGVELGDHSVDLRIDVVDIEDTRVVRLSSELPTRATFEVAALAATRGNGACTVTKFDVIEALADERERRFTVRASLVLYADQLSEEEFTRMTWLYLREVDAIDNELGAVLELSTVGREMNS